MTTGVVAGAVVFVTGSVVVGSRFVVNDVVAMDSETIVDSKILVG